jgi:hypothetical protein
MMAHVLRRYFDDDYSNAALRIAQLGKLSAVTLTIPNSVTNGGDDRRRMSGYRRYKKQIRMPVGTNKATGAFSGHIRDSNESTRQGPNYHLRPFVSRVLRRFRNITRASGRRAEPVPTRTHQDAHPDGEYCFLQGLA